MSSPKLIRSSSAGPASGGGSKYDRILTLTKVTYPVDGEKGAAMGSIVKHAVRRAWETPPGSVSG